MEYSTVYIRHMHKTKKGYRLQLTCSGTGRKSYAVYAIKKVLLEEKI